MEDLLSLAEAAEELGVAPVTLRAAIGRGRFKARKFGNTWVTTRQEVERYRREHLGQVGRPRLPDPLDSLPAPLAEAMRSVKAAHEVPCPTCGAGAGKLCEGLGDRVHIARRSA